MYKRNFNFNINSSKIVVLVVKVITVREYEDMHEERMRRIKTKTTNQGIIEYNYPNILTT